MRLRAYMFDDFVFLPILLLFALVVRWFPPPGKRRGLAASTSQGGLKLGRPNNNTRQDARHDHRAINSKTKAKKAGNSARVRGAGCLIESGFEAQGG